MWCWFAFFLFIFEESLPTEILYHNIEVQAEKREKIKVWYLLKKHHLCFIFNFSLGPCCFWDALNMNNKLDDRIRYDASSWLINKTIIITIIIVIWVRNSCKRYKLCDTDKHAAILCQPQQNQHSKISRLDDVARFRHSLLLCIISILLTLDNGWFLEFNFHLKFSFTLNMLLHLC